MERGQWVVRGAGVSLFNSPAVSLEIRALKSGVGRWLWQSLSFPVSVH